MLLIDFILPPALSRCNCIQHCISLRYITWWLPYVYIVKWLSPLWIKLWIFFFFTLSLWDTCYFFKRFIKIKAAECWVICCLCITSEISGNLAISIWILAEVLVVPKALSSNRDRTRLKEPAKVRWSYRRVWHFLFYFIVKYYIIPI